MTPGWSMIAKYLMPRPAFTARSSPLLRPDELPADQQPSALEQSAVDRQPELGIAVHVRAEGVCLAHGHVAAGHPKDGHAPGYVRFSERTHPWPDVRVIRA